MEPSIRKPSESRWSVQIGGYNYVEHSGVAALKLYGIDVRIAYPDEPDLPVGAAGRKPLSSRPATGR
ncbi:hypothetical protein [Paenibacillus sp. J2TS4]|uniref:hypothetical protein n=1 Tax=Paenibacillus sp. J2TS4 TaxID=2807194 RepID=UPI001BD0FAC1|nr:hypothetical protein [Paenibacillus sp. J2TS4]